MTCEQLFATPIFKKKIIGGDLTDCVKNIQKKDAGVKYSNRGGWHSHSFQEPNKEFTNVWKDIEIHLNTFHKFMGMGDEAYITSMWFNVNTKNSYNIPHNHPMSNYSGVFYIQTPENCGDIHFINPNSISGWIWPKSSLITTNNMNVNSIRYKAEKDTLYIFPSYLQHYVDANKSGEERISLSFNSGIRS